MQVLFWISLWIAAIIEVRGDSSNCFDINIYNLTEAYDAKKYYGALNPFYSINKGISDGLQKTLSQKMLKEVYDFINGDSDKPSVGTMINDVIKSQAGAIAFFCGGLLVILISLILGFFICSCRCCCNGCGANKSKKTKHSIYGAIAMIFGLLVSFAFILTGVVIFNLSANNLYFAINESTTWTAQVINDINSTVQAGTCQTEDVVNNSVNQTFGTLTTQMTQFPTDFTTVMLNTSGVQALFDFNYTALDENIANAQNLINTIQGELITITDGGKCAIEKKNLSDILTNLTMALNITEQNVQLANTTSTSVFNNFTSILTALDTNMTFYINQAISGMDTVETNIAIQMANINNGISETLQIVWNIQNAIQKAQHDIVNWSGYKPVQVSIQAIMSIPNCIAMFFCLLSIIALIFWLVAQDASRSWGYAGVCGFYFVIFLTIVAMGITSVTFVAGWAISGVCKPAFEDNSFRILSVADDISFTIYGFNGKNETVTAQKLMLNCAKNETVFTAVNGSYLITLDDVNNMLNLPLYESDIIGAIDVQQMNYSIDPTTIANIDASLAAIDEAVTVFNNSQKFLNDCNKQDTTNITKDLGALFSELQTIQESLKTLSTELDFANTYGNSNNNQQKAANYTTEQFNQATGLVNASINGLISQLNSSVFPCYGLYQGYENVGTVVCDWLGRPVQGMWGAAGLAAIFFIPVALIMLCSSGVVFNGYRQVKPLASYDDEELEDTNQAVQPSGMRRTYATNDPWSTGDEVYPQSAIQLEQPMPATRRHYDPPTAASAAPWMDDPTRNLRRHDDVLLERRDDDNNLKSGLRRQNESSRAFQGKNNWADDDEDSLDSYDESRSKTRGLQRF